MCHEPVFLPTNTPQCVVQRPCFYRFKGLLNGGGRVLGWCVPYVTWRYDSTSDYDKYRHIYASDYDKDRYMCMKCCDIVYRIGPLDVIICTINTTYSLGELARYVPSWDADVSQFKATVDIMCTVCLMVFGLDLVGVTRQHSDSFWCFKLMSRIITTS